MGWEWDFELSDSGTLIGGGDLALSGDFFFVPRGSSPLDWNATQALGEGTVGTQLVSLSVLSWPSSPFPAPWFLPPLGPLCLRACRVCCIALAPDSPRHTIWHSGSWNLGEHRTGRVWSFDLEETWNHRSLGRAALALSAPPSAVGPQETITNRLIAAKDP